MHHHQQLARGCSRANDRRSSSRCDKRRRLQTFLEVLRDTLLKRYFNRAAFEIFLRCSNGFYSTMSITGGSSCCFVATTARRSAAMTSSVRFSRISINDIKKAVLSVSARFYLNPTAVSSMIMQSASCLRALLRHPDLTALAEIRGVSI